MLLIRRCRRAALSGAVIAALCAWHAGSCQTASAPPGANPQPSDTLETIVVHGEGHREELQAAPTPITVFTETAILDAGIQDTADFIRFVPNMAYDHSFTIGNSFVVMRGIQQLNNGDAPIAIVVDGVPQNNQKEFRMDLFDVQQIEVLRGPQGALYGRNAIGGAVNITTKQPSDEAAVFVQGTAGDDGLAKVLVGASGPWIPDRLFYRVAVFGSTFDGSIRNSFTHDLVDAASDKDIRLQTKWLIDAQQVLDLRLSGSTAWGGAIYDTSFPAGTPDATNTEQDPLSNTPGRSHRDIDSGTLRYSWSAVPFVFTSTTGVTRIREDYYGDLDFCNPQACPGGLFGLGQADQRQLLDVHQWSEELRLKSPDGSRVEWTAGVYGLKTARDLDTLAHILAPTGPVPIVSSREGDSNFAWAGFAQVDVPLGANDRVGVSLRYDRDERHQTDRSSGAERSAAFDSWQPKLTFSHIFDSKDQLYATASKGFRSGGFNGIGGAPFAAERVMSYELGYKSSWLDQRLTWNNAVFYERDHDYQFFYIDLAAGGAQVISNLAQVDIRGAESELTWLISPGFRLNGSLGLLGSRIDDVGSIATNLPIRAGNRAPRTEPYNADLGAQWNFLLGARSAMFRFDVARRGARTWEPDNLDIMDPVTLVNARFTLFPAEHWTLSLWADNLLDHRYYGDFVPSTFSGLGRDVAFPAERRRFGVEFRWDL